MSKKKTKILIELDSPIPGTKCYKWGQYTILVGQEPKGNRYRWHLSISHPKMYPFWDDIRDARYQFMPKDINVAMFLPPPSEYVNIDSNCFHLWEVDLDA